MSSFIFKKFSEPAAPNRLCNEDDRRLFFWDGDGTGGQADNWGTFTGDIDAIFYQKLDGVNDEFNQVLSVDSQGRIVNYYTGDSGNSKPDSRGLFSVDLQTFRTNSNQVASGIGSSLVGGVSNTASASASGVFAGFLNTAAGDNSAVIGGANNVVSANNSVVLGGENLINDIANSALSQISISENLLASRGRVKIRYSDAELATAINPNLATFFVRNVNVVLQNPGTVEGVGTLVFVHNSAGGAITITPANSISGQAASGSDGLITNGWTAGFVYVGSGQWIRFS
jgi:hypothetical protein